MGRVGGAGRGALLRALVFVLVWSVVPVLPAEATAQSLGVRVPILTYHNVDYSGSTYSVTPEQLEAQLQWLQANGFTAITLGQFWAAATGGGALPPNPVVLTVDDGWASAVTFADIAGRYGMTATYFINNVSALTADQILSLSQRGSVQAHTATHAMLPGMSYESQYAEIAENMAYITGITGQPVQFLAWPFGESDANAVQAAAAAGIIGAFGLGGTAANTAAINPYQIPRIMMDLNQDITLFASMVTLW